MPFSGDVSGCYYNELLGMKMSFQTIIITLILKFERDEVTHLGFFCSHWKLLPTLTRTSESHSNSSQQAAGAAVGFPSFTMSKSP